MFGGMADHPSALSMTLPVSGPAVERLLTVDVLRKCLTTLVSAWQAELGMVDYPMSFRLPGKLPMFGLGRTGWLTYLPVEVTLVPPIPEPSWVEPMAPKGCLVIICEERFDIENQAHLGAANTVEAKLTSAGLLPAPPGLRQPPSTP
jgi:hypothetical protein